MLTNSELKQIKDYLALYGKKDSQLEAVNVDLDYPEVTFEAEDYLSVVQDNKNKTIKIKDLEKVFLLTFLTDEDFREALKGKIPEEMLENACVTTEKLADSAVTTIKLGNSAVTTAKIANGAITNEKIADNTIQGSAFAANSITTDKIVDGTVTGDKLADGSIQSVDIKDNTLSGSKFVNGSISGSKIQDDAIESKHLLDNSIPASKIKDGSIESIDIKDGTLDGAKIKDNTIESAKLADNAVTIEKIKDHSIITSKIADGAVTEDKIVDDSITTNKIANSSVTTDKIVDEAITEDKLANGAVTTAKLADGLISEIQNITDATPTEGSVKPVQSGGVKTAIDNIAFSTNEKVKNVGIDDEPTAGSDNLVKSGGVVNLFESQYGNASSDLDITDEIGNAIVQFKNGHIKTKEFNSEDSSALLGELTETTAQHTTKLATIEEGAEVNDTDIIENPIIEDFGITDENENCIISISGGYPVTKNFNGKNIKEELNALKEEVSESDLYETEIVNIADYNNNLLDVYAVISPSEKKHYTILIPEGVYNVHTWFSAEYISASQTDSTKRGVVLKDYTKLLGVGRTEKIILQWINADGYPNRLVNISTLNTRIWNELENLTVVSNNARYAVHDDPSLDESRHLRVKNCVFKTSDYTTRAWGAGFHKGRYDAVFENCQFIIGECLYGRTQTTYIEPFVLHDYSSNTDSDSSVVFKNCRFVTPCTSSSGQKYYSIGQWERITYDNTYNLYDGETGYAVGDCVNMQGDTDYSYRCLIANTAIHPWYSGRASIGLTFGATGATGVLYATFEGCYFSTYVVLNPRLVRMTGFYDKWDAEPVYSSDLGDGLTESEVVNII